MPVTLRKWLPVALCCLPGVAIAGIVGIGIAAGGAAASASFGGPLGLAVIGLALSACPVSMGLMLLRRQRGLTQNSAPVGDTPSSLADCCLPGQTVAVSDADSPGVHLLALRAQREALEREVADLEAL